MDIPEPDYIALYPPLARMAGFALPVVLATKLHDRLEVVDEWQPHESFDARALTVLKGASTALQGTGKASFSVSLRNNHTGLMDDVGLVARFSNSGSLVVIYYSEDD